MAFDPKAVRTQNLKTLKAAGFTVASSLPIEDAPRPLRPVGEIAGRLAALSAWFVFICAPERVFPTAALRRHIRDNALEAHLTDDERSVLALDRKQAGEQAGEGAGWRMENCLSLAWILGAAAVPSIDGEMIQGDDIKQIVECPPVGTPRQYAAWLASLSPRPADTVAAMEDLFYCCHNAVRSAQVEVMNARPGRKLTLTTVPRDFDPMVSGGVIHERRHALTWALSPGVPWDETDLST